MTVNFAELNMKLISTKLHIFKTLSLCQVQYTKSKHSYIIHFKVTHHFFLTLKNISNFLIDYAELMDEYIYLNETFIKSDIVFFGCSTTIFSLVKTVLEQKLDISDTFTDSLLKIK